MSERKDVNIMAPPAVGGVRALPPNTSPLPPEFWNMDHNCPLCHKTLPAAMFVQHAPDCIKHNMPKGKLWVPRFNPREDGS